MFKIGAFREHRDRGAGTLEYLGIVIVAAVLIAGVTSAIGRFGLYDLIECHVQNIGRAAPVPCAGGADVADPDFPGVEYSGPGVASVPALKETGGNAQGDQSSEAHFANAIDRDQSVDQDRVDLGCRPPSNHGYL